MSKPPAAVRSLPGFVRYWASVVPDGTAVYDADTVLTWRDLDVLIDGFQRVLRDRGVVRGDRVLLAGGNTVGWVVGFLAVQRMGAVVAPTNNRISATQLWAQAHQLDARAVLHDDRVGEQIAGVSRQGRGAVSHRLGELLQLAKTSADAGVVEAVDDSPDGLALVSFTSGTTGDAKGTMIGHAALVAMARAFAQYFCSDRTSSTLVMVPLFHNTGFVDQLAHMLAAGGSIGLLERYRTADAIVELRRRPVSFLAAVPSIVRMLMLSDNSGDAFAGVRSLMYGGSSMPSVWIRELLAAHPHMALVHAYGLSEFTSVCTFLPAELALAKGESVGLPLPGVEIRIVGDDGCDVEPAATGEVWLRGETRMDGYWRRPDLTAQKLEGRWLRTGDIGHLDAEGLLWLDGRVDDVINRGGEKILPSNVESCILQEPGVAEASVFGYPDPVLLSRVAAAVSMRPGAVFDEESVRRRLAGMLPDYAIPDRWLVLDGLPVTPTGKVDRRRLAADFGERDG